MINRLVRTIVGLIWLGTIIFTIIPSLILWVILGRFYVMEIAEWVVTGEYPYKLLLYFVMFSFKWNITTIYKQV